MREKSGHSPDAVERETEVKTRERSRFFGRIEDAKREWFIPEQERVEKQVRDSNGNIIGVAIDTHHANARIHSDITTNTVEGEGDHGEEIVWVVIDFDDVVNRTTEYQKFLKQKFSELGLSETEFEKIYAASTVPGDNKPIFRYDIFLERVKATLQGKEGEIESFLHGIPYNDFIDQGVLRALESLKAQLDRVKITLLTFGEQQYQQMRIGQTEIDKIADQIVYTNGSKREVVEALRREEYAQPPFPTNLQIFKPEDFAFTMIVDDNPDQLQDFSRIQGMPKSMHVRYRHPSTKRYRAPTGANEVVEFEEGAKNQAALNIYRAAVVGSRFSTWWTNLGRGHSKELPKFQGSLEPEFEAREKNHIYTIMLNPEKYEAFMAEINDPRFGVRTLGDQSIPEQYILSAEQARR